MSDFSKNFPKAWAVADQGRREGLHLGAQVYIERDGELLADCALGETRPGVEMAIDTINPWFSAVKPVGAVAVGQLYEQGRLDLDDPVTQHIPEFAHGGKESITLRHILMHTGGFRALMLKPGQPRRWDAIIEQICKSRLEPNWEVGEDAGYHVESSWYILGEIVGRVSGVFFGDYVRQEIYEPLGMRDSWIGIPTEFYDENEERIGWVFDTSKPEHRENPQPNGMETRERATHCSPGGNGRGPIRELGRFYAAMLAGGVLEGTRILEPDTVRLLTANHRIGIYDKTFRDVIDWGLGFIRDSKHHGQVKLPYGFGAHASGETFGHGGRETTVGMADPAHKLVIAAMFNGMPGEARHQDRMHNFLTALYEDLGLD